MKRKKLSAIRVGVIGLGRGFSFATEAEQCGMKLVALCDQNEEYMKLCSRCMGVDATLYTDYDRFLEHDMDAVILGNNFHEHAPFAIKALQAGFHVMSETQACHTLAEGVALARSVEKSGKIYMFAENYPFNAVNLELRRLYLKGEIGELKYGEGAYVHPMSAWHLNWLSPGINHWRNWIPATYYCTHAMAPIMHITETRPVKVSGFVVPYDFDDPAWNMTVSRKDIASAIMCTMDNDAVVRLLQIHLRGHIGPIRIFGNKGFMENEGGFCHVQNMPFDRYPYATKEKRYQPKFPPFAHKAAKAGHGGGDFFMNYYFAKAIRTDEQPFLDVYRGIDMSIIGILAYRSALQKNVSLEVPDFRKESVRKKYERDDWSPDPARRKPGQPWPSVLGHIQPSQKSDAYAKQAWRERETETKLKSWKETDIHGRVVRRFAPEHVLNLLSGGKANKLKAILSEQTKK